MSDITRRKFLELGVRLSALLGLAPVALPRVAEALNALSTGAAPVLWLQGQSCSGCSVALLNSEHPGPAELLTKYISLHFHSTLSTATGHIAMETIHRSIENGDNFLVVEGSMPVGMPEACLVGEEPVIEQVARAAQKAKAVIAIGSCASWGGIPGADNNPTGAKSVPDFLASRNISTPIIRLPGCPSHPDWLVGTLVHVLKFGLPELDEMNRPVAFFGRLIHEQCPRFADYEREHFASKFSDEGCLFKLGCLGPVTKADCPRRFWNGGTNFCINAGAPCVGCASESFAKSIDLPFYRHAEFQTGKDSKG